MEKTKIFNRICIVLMGLLLILQMLPFWNYDGISISIQGYVWLEPDNVELGEYLASYVDVGDSYLINKVILMPFMVLVLTIVGIILCIWKNNIYTSLIPLACGAIGAWGYLAKPVFQLGTNWGIHLVVCIAMLVVAVTEIYFLIKEE